MWFTSGKDDELDKVQDFVRGDLCRDLVSLQKDVEYNVVANPFSGAGKALFYYWNIIKPMFNACGAKVNLVETTHAGHLHTLGSSLATALLNPESTPSHPYTSAHTATTSDVQIKYSGDLSNDAVGAVCSRILVCGGDGSLQELVNGLIFGASGGSMKVEGSTERLMRAVWLAPIPCGTCNGLAVSLDVRTVYDACISVLKARAPIGLDVWKADYFDQNKNLVKSYYDVHVISAGLVAQVDQLEETTFRWLGPVLKKIIAPLWMILLKPTLRAKLMFKPHFKHLDGFCALYKQQGYHDPNDLPTERINGEEWKTLEQEATDTLFSYFLNANASWGASDILINKHIRLDDGAGTILFVHGGITRWRLLKALLKMESGQHVFEPETFCYSTVEFKIQFTKGPALISSSGETSITSSLHAKVLPSLCRLIMSD